MSENTTFPSPELWGWNQELSISFIDLINTDPSPDSLRQGWTPARVISREQHFYGLACPDFSNRFPNLQGPFPGPGVDNAQAMAPLVLEGVRVSGRFTHQARGPADFPAVGDWVCLDSRTAEGRIQGLIPRLGSVSRKAAGDETVEQVLAANVTVLLLVFGLDGGRNLVPGLIERSVAAAWNSGAQPVLVLNKADCAGPDDRVRATELANRHGPGVPQVMVSARTGEGIEELRALLRPGDTIGMLGKSGVGKSALINALGEQKTAREGEQRKGDRQGTHTTTSSTLYRIPGDLMIIDSPGLRELQIWGETDIVNQAFPEIEELARGCRFRDCTHNGEPGCAIQGALEAGTLGGDRWGSYQSLMAEQAWLERKTNQKAMLDERAKWKQIAKAIRTFKKPGRD